ncbi:unnamed protein product [Plutella xylostella]|uniref:(diamondback moth) hypothetical protein n=1 Tax=Plutella xylostella TaxID=51655 RepID=A0A8S4G8N5_PLUXY|nr:unnamed protein product [Plutella xylostella]
MASHLAAQDYLHRLQASGLSFGGGMDPYSALSALQPPKQQNNKHASKGSDRCLLPLCYCFGGGMDPYSALSALQPPKQQNNKHASKGSDR